MRAYFEKIKELFTPATRPLEEQLEILRSNIEEYSEEEKPEYAEVPHAGVGELQIVKSAAKGHGEQTVLPDECQYGDNDLCYVEA